MKEQEIQNRILEAAKAAYPDNLVPATYAEAMNPEIFSDVGDTLAVFVAKECGEVVKGYSSLSEAAAIAAQAMENAMDELSQVANVLHELSIEASKKEKSKPMKDPDELTKEQLVEVVRNIQRALYCNELGFEDPDKEWDSDTPVAVAEALAEYDLEAKW